jgi:hypothetical protein
VSQIEKQLEELDETDLKKKICLRCLVSGYPIKGSLYDEKELKPSPSNGDLICPECSVLEAEQKGHKKISRGEFDYATRVIKAFEDYKTKKGLN